MDVTLAICARNEQGLIAAALGSLAASARRLPATYRWRLQVCINGSSDQTEAMVGEWIKQNHDVSTLVTVLPIGNLVEAQRAVADRARVDGVDVLGFFDADIEIDPDCVPALVGALDSEGVRVAYATSHPIAGATSSFIERVLNMYDLTPTVFTPRFHIHGRAFVLRTVDWAIPRTNPPLNVDDIYLSFFVLRTYGSGAIKCVSTAVVRFIQVTTLADYYRVFRRRNLEVQRCQALFPEFQSLPSEQVNRRFLWSHWRRETLRRKAHWLVLLLLRSWASFRLRLENRFGSSTKALWIPSVSSKRRLSEPIVVLIEGLDCSGKKTLAESVHRALTGRGVASAVNTGPLSSRWYNRLVRVVSQNSVPNIFRSVVYALEGFGDRRGARSMTVDVVLQVSSPYRSWAYSLVHRLHFRAAVSRLLQPSFVRYRLVWLLTAPYELRLKRHESQAAAGLNPDKLERRFPDPYLFAQMDEILHALLVRYSRVDGRFEAPLLSVEEMTGRVVDEIMSVL